MENTLYFGDNLSVLKGHDGQGQPYFPDACIDLIYLDPPFNSNRYDNVLTETTYRDSSRRFPTIGGDDDREDFNDP